MKFHLLEETRLVLVVHDVGHVLRLERRDSVSTIFLLVDVRLRSLIVIGLTHRFRSLRPRVRTRLLEWIDTEPLLLADEAELRVIEITIAVPV